MSELNFSLNGYNELLQQIKEAGYVFADFRDPQNAKQCYLRHDVDISHINCLAMGKIENEHAAKAHYFFQLNTETYQIFSQETLNIMKKLQSMGHSVGLHIDELILGTDEGKISKTITWFKETILDIDPIVSFHRPSEAVINRHFEAFINTYDSPYFKHYFSDSRRNTDFYPQFIEALKSGVGPIQFLTHPVWWSNLQGVPAIVEGVQNRRLSELNRYLSKNFKKVLGIYIDPSEENHII